MKRRPVSFVLLLAAVLLPLIVSLSCGNNDAANPEVDSLGRTPLHLAAAAADLKQMEELVSHGAPLEARTKRGSTPIWSAVGANSLDAVKLLADEGADLEVSVPPFGSLVDYAFYTESRLGWSGITDFLIQEGVAFDPDEAMLGGLPRIFVSYLFGHSEMLEYLLTLSPDVNVRRPTDGSTPLIDAVRRGNGDAVKALLEYGADLDITDNDGRPAIYYAAKKGFGTAMATFLHLNASFDYIEPETGRTLLHLAAIAGDWTTAQQLMVAGAVLDLKDDSHQRPIDLAWQYGNKMIAKTLELRGIKRGKDADADYGKSRYLTSPPKPGGAVAWYLRGRGWAIKTTDHFVVFDSEDGRAMQSTNPWLANGSLYLHEIEDQNIVALYTTYHGTGDDKERIHTYEDSIKQIAFVHNEGDPWRGCRNTTYLSPGDTTTVSGLLITALAPTEPDQAPPLVHLVEGDGLNILYCGFAEADTTATVATFAPLAASNKKIDLAFLPLPEPGSEDESDFKYVIEHFKPKAVCLLDPDRREFLFRAAADKASSWGYKGKVFCAENPGDHFVFSK